MSNRVLLWVLKVILSKGIVNLCTSLVSTETSVILCFTSWVTELGKHLHRGVIKALIGGTQNLELTSLSISSAWVKIHCLHSRFCHHLTRENKNRPSGQRQLLPLHSVSSPASKWQNSILRSHSKETRVCICWVGYTHACWNGKCPLICNWLSGKVCSPTTPAARWVQRRVF